MARVAVTQSLGAAAVAIQATPTAAAPARGEVHITSSQHTEMVLALCQAVVLGLRKQDSAILNVGLDMLMEDQFVGVQVAPVLILTLAVLLYARKVLHTVVRL